MFPVVLGGGEVHREEGWLGLRKKERTVSRYPAFVDREAGAYGVTFPDLPGIVAMGETMDDALVNAEEALRDYVMETERDGAQIAEASPMENVPPPEGSVLFLWPSRSSASPDARFART